MSLRRFPLSCFVLRAHENALHQFHPTYTVALHVACLSCIQTDILCTLALSLQQYTLRHPCLNGELHCLVKRWALVIRTKIEVLY